MKGCYQWKIYENKTKNSHTENGNVLLKFVTAPAKTVFLIFVRLTIRYQQSKSWNFDHFFEILKKCKAAQISVYILPTKVMLENSKRLHPSLR